MSDRVCCFDGCMDGAMWTCVRNGKIVGYYCDKHLYVKVLENSSDYYRWFRIKDYKFRSIREILYGEGGEATVERVAYLLGISVEDVLSMAQKDGVKIVRKKYDPIHNYYITLLSF